MVSKSGLMRLNIVADPTHQSSKESVSLFLFKYRERDMRKRQALVTLVAASLLFPPTAVRADGPEIATPEPPWSGVYVGIQAGGGWAETGWYFPVDSYFTLPAGNRSFDATPDGGIFGGHITWNRQIGSFVFGAELAFNSGNVEATDYGTFDPLFPNDKFDTSVENYGTVTARLGFVSGDYLLYVAGGYARGSVNFHAVSGPPGAGVVGNVDRHLNGATVGGGIDYQLTEKVFLGLQYSYVWLDGELVSIATTGTPSTDPFILRIQDVDLHAITARLSLRLGGAP